MGAGGRYKLRIHGVGRAGTSTVFPQAVFALCDSTKTLRCLVPASRAGRFKNEKQTREKTMKIRRGPKMQYILLFFGQYRTIPALRLKHRSGDCGTASALPKCSIESGCGTRIVLRGQKPLALCDRCPCFGSLHPPLAALTFAASSIICAFGLALRSPYRHLELCGIALVLFYLTALLTAFIIKPISKRPSVPITERRFSSFQFYQVASRRAK